MIQVVRCYNCGKMKQWKVGNKKPKWFEKKVPRTDIISPKNHGLTLTVEFCSKHCLNNQKEKDEGSKMV